MRRFWWAPLAIAALVDLLLFGHAHFAASAQVDRAVRRSLVTPGCQEAVLVRTAGGPDDLTVLHVTVGGTQEAVLDMQVEFGPGGTLTAASRQSVATGSDASMSVNPIGSGVGTVHPLLDLYAHQVGSGANWLNGACLPLPSPRASSRRQAGSITFSGSTYRLFRGSGAFKQNGRAIFQTPAKVWMGVAGDGTLAFAVVEGKLAQTGVDALFASTFNYSSAAVTSLPAAGAAAGTAPATRMQYYATVHSAMEALLARLGVTVPAALAAPTGRTGAA